MKWLIPSNLMKSNLSHINIAIPGPYGLVFAFSFFSSFYFSPVCLYLMCVSCRWHIAFLSSATNYFFVFREFNGPNHQYSYLFYICPICYLFPLSLLLSFRWNTFLGLHFNSTIALLLLFILFLVVSLESVVCTSTYFRLSLNNFISLCI